jgi:uncharacterized protein (TIGR02117 family)
MKPVFFRAFIFHFIFFFFKLPVLLPNDTIYIVQTAWHTGILLKTASVSSEIFPEIKNYSQTTYIDVGWGDEKFYQAEGIPVGLAARAVLIPTSSVVRIVGYRHSIDELYSDGRKEAIIMDSEEFSALCSFISGNLKRDTEGRIISSRVKGTSKIFFESTKKYHLFRTCNTWVALALKESGLEISSCCIITARQLFRRIKKLRK